LHPSLLVHTAWIAGSRRLVAQADASRPPLVLRSPVALAALAALPARFDRRSADAAWREAGVGEEAREQLWQAFSHAGLFADAGDEPAWWERLEWREAWAYHAATRDYPFVQMDERGAVARDTERMRSYQEEAPAPPVYQHVGADAVELPRPRAAPDELLERMAPEQRLGVEGLSLLLDVCFGERGRMLVASGDTCLLKSIPSGGGRHPTEVFVAAFELHGLAPGIYHYDVEHHRLEQVRAGQQRDAFAQATFDLFTRYREPPAAALAFTALVERAMWRYRDPRSFRAVLVDVGHAVAAYRHVARLLGFRTFAYPKLRDGEVAELLGVDPWAQPALYVGTLVP
jgi:SagB-type dehydrogenase family enzyme